MKLPGQQERSLLFKLYFKKVSFPIFLHVLIRCIMMPFKDVERFIPVIGRVLDFGCGYGFFSYFMYFKSDKRKIVGLDIDKKRIDIINKIKPVNNNIIFTNKGIDIFKEKEFDAVVVNDVLYLISYKGQEVLLNKVYDVLKDNGTLIIKIMDSRLRFKFLLNEIQEFFSVKIFKHTKCRDKNFCFYENIQLIRAIVNKVGFFVEEVKLDKGFLHPHLLLSCSKRM